MSGTNRQWRLRVYPRGLPRVDDWELVEGPIPAPGPGEILARAIYLDVAPYMRVEISPRSNRPRAGVRPGDVMIGGGVGEVVHSNSAGYRPGDLVVTDFAFGWQEFAVLSPTDVRRVDPSLAPLPYWLDVLGFNGLTAYFGLIDVASIRPGDTVLVSAAAGSVGQIAGQIVKISGGRAIAVTSTEEKLAWCRELGYDDGIAYRSEPDLAAAVARVCPDGVDVFFDNTAGPIHDAVMQNLAPNARVALCGLVSLADRYDEPDIGPRFLREILFAGARVQGFAFPQYSSRFGEARDRLSRWLVEGRIRSAHDIVSGLENLPEAFLRVLTSRNIGKQMVKVGELRVVVR